MEWSGGLVVERLSSQLSDRTFEPYSIHSSFATLIGITIPYTKCDSVSHLVDHYYNNEISTKDKTTKVRSLSTNIVISV